MAFWAIISDIYKHAWRFKLHLVFIGSLLLLVLGLPSLLKSDGTADGKVRLFLQYSGHFMVLMLSFISVIWVAWLEQFERKHQVDLMIAIRPVKKTTIILAKLIGHLSIIFLFALGLSLGVAYIGYKIIESSSSSEEDKNQAYQRLVEIRSYSEISLSEETKNDIGDIKFRRENSVGIALRKGEIIRFDYIPKVSSRDQEIKGSLRSMSNRSKTDLYIRARKDREVLWVERQKIQSGKDFFFQVPDYLVKLSPLTLELRHMNENDTVFYYIPNEPLVMTIPQGSLLLNVVLGAFLLMGLCSVLIALSLFFSHIISFKSCLLVITFIYIIGIFKLSIRELLFPVRNFDSMVEQSMSFNEIFYRILWEPILFLIPDFAELNPTYYFANGEAIRLNMVLVHYSSIVPFLILILVYLFYRLPRIELGARS